MKKWITVFLTALCLLGAMAHASALREVWHETPSLPIRQEENSFDVYMLKRALYSMGYEDVNDHRDHPRYAPEFTYEFDSHMLDAVLDVQRRQGLEESGEVDEATMEAILPGYLAAIENRAPMLGTMSETVRKLQQDLTALRFYAHDITGNMGEYTEAAVKRFQEACGLPATGYADAATMEAIAREMESKSR